MYTSIESLSPYRILRADEHSAGKNGVCVCWEAEVGRGGMKTSKLALINAG